MSQKRRNIIRITAAVLFVLSALTVSGCGKNEKITREHPLTVSFVDVGQGDGILIEFEDSVIAVDGGENENTYLYNAYLKKRGIRTIDTYIITHPHSDHIGAVPGILSLYNVKSFVMPYFSEMNIPTTKTYEKMLNAVVDEDCEVMTPEVGDTLDFGELRLEFLAPIAETDNYNDMSLVIKAVYKNTSFLLMGDAEKSSESLILESGADIDADLIKIGHHGSNSSTGMAFLEAVSPQYAVISCGKDNDYGHPHAETLKLLEKYGVTVYRTDLSGNIVFYSNGDKIIPEQEAR